MIAEPLFLLLRADMKGVVEGASSRRDQIETRRGSRGSREAKVLQRKWSRALRLVE